MSNLCEELVSLSSDKCVVVNKYKSEYDVYIGRGSIWGNPFPVGEHGTRQAVIAKYSKHLADCLLNGTIKVSDLAQLKGKRLGCFCHPKPCHGDVIAKLVNKL